MTLHRSLTSFHVALDLTILSPACEIVQKTPAAPAAGASITGNLGALGIDGAYNAIRNGQVDLNWAKVHHNLWVEEVQAAPREAPKGDATLAE